MQVSELRVNTLYKLVFPSAATSFLNDDDTRITIVATDGDYDADTPNALLPFANVDYLNYTGNGAFSVDDYQDYNTAQATDATYIIYYITSKYDGDCTVLAQYSEPCYMNNVIKITQSNYSILYSAFPNSATITTNEGDVTTTYDPNAVYLIVDDQSKKYRHNILLLLGSDILATSPIQLLQFSFINNKSISYGDGQVPLSKYLELCNDLNSCGFTSQDALCPATGHVEHTSGQFEQPIGIYGTSGSTITASFGYKYIKLTSSNNMILTINQYVSTSNSGHSLSGLSIAASRLYDTVEEI